ncbi:hypothetical protein ANRL1_03659 [Anaerolineae bacterium]|nr:hypothetical protein ANRL1_03659 [Anaerolineae bacterium]
MPQEALQKYFVFFFHEWQIPDQGYYWIAEVEGSSPKEALKTNLPFLIQSVREFLETDVVEYKVERNLYIVPADFWMSYSAAHWQASLSSPAI